MDTSFRAKVFPWLVRIGVAFTLCVAFGGLFVAEAELRRGAETPLPALPKGVEEALHARSVARTVAEPMAAVTLRRGETFSDALVDLGLENGDAQQAVTAALRYVDPRSLQPGDRFLAFGARGGVPASIHVALSGRGELRLARQGGAWEPSWRASQRSVKIRTLSAVLDGSLDGSIRSAGGPALLAYRMSDVLQWDLDFNRDLQPGDRFAVLYEDVYLDGVPMGPGQVLAMRYESGGRTLQAYRYGADDYYDENGRPLKKMFLKSPLPYSRVTSKFSTQRFHPILKKVVPHWGIDLGAPVGTPVRATGSGVVLSAGWEGGGGKAIRIRHPNGYVSGYLHLSGYASAVRAGARVTQGEVIGYVGQTGLATGPHLDYRVQQNGKWINPMSLKGVESPVIAQKDLNKFASWRDALRASLDSAQPLPVAPAPSGGVELAAASQPTTVREVTVTARR
jgi:murein DD-endopeptidase MepM/ murein hydrolase activator NlpD